jgi:hypothetical protein
MNPNLDPVLATLFVELEKALKVIGPSVNVKKVEK